MKELNNLTNACEKSGSARYALEHLHITKKFAEATNGRMLVRLKMKTDVDNKCVSATSIKKLGEDIKFNDESVTDGELSCKYATDFDFPNTKSVMESEMKGKTLVTALNTELLAQLLKCLPKKSTVSFYGSGDKNKGITFSCGDYYGVILPMQSNAPDKVEDLINDEEEREKKDESESDESTDDAIDDTTEEGIEESVNEDVKEEPETVERTPSVKKLGSLEILA